MSRIQTSSGASTGGGGGSGTVTAVSVVSANGFAGTVAMSTTTPAITVSTTITGLLKGNGTAVSSATAGTDYVIPSGSITGTSGNITATSNSTLITLSSLSLPVSQLTGTLPIGNGGTGQTTAASAYNALSPMTTTGDMEYESATHVASRLPIGTTGQVLTVVAGIPTWAAPATNGTVTSVALSTPGVLYTVSGSPVTTSGTLTLNLVSQSANTIFAGPTTGAAAAPTFRTLVSADVPTLNQNTTGTAANITATTNSTLITLSSLSLSGSQVNGFTQGSIIFAGSTGQLSQDNSNFYWNDATYSLGLGVIPATNAAVDVVSSTGTSKAIQTTSYGAGSSIPFRGRFARGTSSSPAAAQSGDNLSVFSGRGYGASQFAAASTGAINITANETFTNTSNATYIQLLTTPTGSVTSVPAMTVNSTSNVLIGILPASDNNTDQLQMSGGASTTYLKLKGSTSGYVEQIASATTTSYVVTWPPTQGGANTVPVNNGSGALSWTATPSPYIIQTISSNTTAVSGTTYLCNTSGGPFTVTLPAPVSGAFIIIKDSTGFFGTNNLTVAQHASELIEGLAVSKVLQTNWGCWSFFSDGTNWFMGPF